MNATIEPNQIDKSASAQLQEKTIVQQPVQVLTCIERATNLVDNVTDFLYAEILSGLQAMNKRKKINSPQQNNAPIKHPTVDIDLHKRMIRKFMRMNRKSIRSIEKRSIQFQQELKKNKQQELARRSKEKHRTLELRREQISQRLQTKEKTMQQIKMKIKQSNVRFGIVKSKKFLYQEKEQAFKREVLLPRIEEQKRILTKIKERARPIDMSEIFEHQRQYQEKLVNDRLNRSLTSRVIQNQNAYDPPKFISKAYLIAEAEQQIKKQQQRLKQQTLQINEYRKKEFIKVIQQKQRQQLQKIKQQASQKIINQSPSDKIKRQKLKIQLDRQETKKIGNQYMKQLINLNRKHRNKPSSELSLRIVPQAQVKPKSQYEIELIKEERIQKVQKIRLKKIEDILNSNRMDQVFKLERLQYEKQKFEEQLKLLKDAPGQKISQADEVASLVLSSIHTKLAILDLTTPNK